MANLRRHLLLPFALLILRPDPASAGMPSFTLADLPSAARSLSQNGLTDLARQRFEVISFFLMGLFACAGVIRWVWNGLRKDFPLLPRLSYPRAVGLVVLWGLLFVLILTMISGARELMTPGAWEKKGLTYRLAPPPPVTLQIKTRAEALQRLFGPLAYYAKAHGGYFPSPPDAQVIAQTSWTVPSPPGGRYRYVGGRLPDDDEVHAPAILAYEPDSAGADRLVLMTNGQVLWLPAEQIKAEASPEER